MTEVAKLPEVAISIQQPWSALIIYDGKDIENRTWKTNFRGRVLLHTGKMADVAAIFELTESRHPVTGEKFKTKASVWPLGGIVGVAEIVDCVSASKSPWFVGPYGFVIANAQPLPFMPMRGQLGIFKAKYELAETAAS